MLVIISDLHLTDGSSGASVGADAFRILKDRVAEIVERASWRADKKYKPIESVDLVLLGDIFDLIRSDKWLKSGIRPWDDLDNETGSKLLENIVAGIIEKNREGLTVMKGMTESIFGQGKLSIPCSIDKDIDGEICKEGQQVVNTRIFYMIGNHDWFFYLKGKRFNKIREMVVDAFGLSQPADQAFPYEPNELPELEQALKNHQVYACHGDKYDPFNFTKRRDQSSIGDAIVIELLNKFPDKVKKEFEKKVIEELPSEFVAGLKEIDNVRPLITIPFWIDGLLDKTVPDRKVQKRIKEIWNDLVCDFLEIDFIKSQNTLGLFDQYDQLKYLLQFTTIFDFDMISDLVQLVYKRFNGSGKKHSKNFLNEKEFINQESKYFVCGHTHHYEVVPLQAAYKDAKKYNQYYINSGTWKPVHQKAENNFDDNNFLNYNVMTYLIFYHGDERKGREFEVWSGVLDTH